MKRNYRQRPLAYEQLERKAAPSSFLIVVSGDETGAAEFTDRSIATHGWPANDDRYETEQILRFVAENTTASGRIDRSATLPTAAQCAAADEMMRLIPAGSNSLLVMSFYDDGAEL